MATSLSEGEQLQKHVGILHIHKRTFKLEKRPLKTVRQFYFLNIQLTDHIDERALKSLSTTKIEQKLDKVLTETVREQFIFLKRASFLGFHPTFSDQRTSRTS